METTSDDKQFIYINSAHFHQTGLAHVLINQTIRKHFEAIAIKDLHETMLNMSANAARINSHVCDIAAKNSTKKCPGSFPKCHYRFPDFECRSGLSI
jgi:hypothetical protein